MSGEPRIPCSACHGHGEVDLPAPYRQTLGRLTGRWVSTDVVLRKHNALVTVRPKRTALINRLNALVRWGLVDRRGGRMALEWRKI